MNSAHSRPRQICRQRSLRDLLAIDHQSGMQDLLSGQAQITSAWNQYKHDGARTAPAH